MLVVWRQISAGNSPLLTDASHLSNE